MKTVLHIDEAKKWPLTLGNAKNMVKYAEEMGIDFDLEIVANDEPSGSCRTIWQRRKATMQILKSLPWKP